MSMKVDVFSAFGDEGCTNGSESYSQGSASQVAQTKKQRIMKPGNLWSAVY